MKRPGDKTPDPPGGRAAERLRQFEEARLPPEERAERERAEREREEREEQDNTEARGKRAAKTSRARKTKADEAEEGQG
jgi:hypothetical protein